MGDKEFYTVSEFCEIFRISSRTFYRWNDQKKVNAIKIGHAYLISANEVARLMNCEKEENAKFIW